MVLVTHAIGLAVRVAEHVIVMKGGEVIAQGTPNEVASNPDAAEINDSVIYCCCTIAFITY